MGLSFLYSSLAIIFVTICSGLISWIFYPVYLIRKLSKTRLSKKDMLYVTLNSSTSIEIEEITSTKALPLLDLTIILPAFNEEFRLPGTLESTLDYLNKWCETRGLSYEVIVVDDGSRDNTSQICMNYMKRAPELRLLKLEKNCGKGGAILRGVQRSRGRYILMADADGATDIQDLEKLYNSLLKTQTYSELLGGNMGAAIGSRAHLEKDSVVKRAFYRTILMYGLHLCVLFFCTNKIRDTQCGFKLFTAATAKFIFPMLHLERWSFDIELIYLLDTLKIPMIEVGVRWQEVPGSKLIEKSSDIIFVSLTMLRDMVCVRMCYLLTIWTFHDFKEGEA